MTKEFWLCFTMTATQQTYSNPPEDYDNVDIIIYEFNKVHKVDWRAEKNTRLSGRCYKKRCFNWKRT